MSGPRHSALYQGTISHARRGPTGHAFGYALYMLYLDLDELPGLAGARGPLRRGRLGLLSFERSDYLGDPSRDLAGEVRDRVERELGFRPEGPVRLLTHVRSLGYVFNPVSFYFCHGAGGELEAIVAEITNTPWNERHAYVLRAGAAGAASAFPKAFHVSPFLPMAQRYRWSFTAPGEALAVEMLSYDEGGEAFRAQLSLRRRPWSSGALWRAALLQPLMAWKVHLAIYLQALRLWWKGAPFHPHPAPARRAGQVAAPPGGRPGEPRSANPEAPAVPSRGPASEVSP